MSMATIARKPVAQFVPSSSPAKAARIQPGRSLGLKRMEIPTLLKVITSGLRWSAVESFLQESGFTQLQLAQYLGIPVRTLARRKEVGGLDENESERLLRLSEIYDAALDLFNGDKADAREWLLSFEFQNEPALSSRYVRTVWDTALVVISMAVITLLNTPPPDIVYKTF